MIDLKLRVVWQGEKFETTEIKGSDVVALERQFNLSLTRLRDFTFEQACFLVWRSMRRAGKTDLPFDDEFLDGIEDLEQVDVPFEGPPAEASPG